MQQGNILSSTRNAEKIHTGESLHIVDPLVLHGVKVFIRRFVPRVLQQDPSGRRYLDVKTQKSKQVTLRLYITPTGFILIRDHANQGRPNQTEVPVV